jgi:uncharacterized integral membrane protein
MGTGTGSDQAPAAKKERKPGRRFGKDHVIVALLVALATAFALLNLNHVKVDFIVSKQRAPLIVVIVICLVVGFVIGAATGRQRRRRRS